jgi:hypothetical protein
MRILHDEEDDGPILAADHVPGFLHGMWRDEVRGSTMCIDGRVGEPLTVYCSGGDHELTGVYLRWQLRRGQLLAEFRWLREPISGVVVLQAESNDSLVGGWWYHRDVPNEQRTRLPFVPGVHPCRWIRQDPRRPWPIWACERLDLATDGSLTSESLAAVRSDPQRGATEPGAAGRYRQRIALWTDARTGLAGLTARLRHHGWWLLHNLVAHPLLAVLPARPAVALHDWTSRRLNRDPTLERSGTPRVERRLWWILHNLVAHPAIGLAPCATTFRWHDASARRMRVAGWI